MAGKCTGAQCKSGSGTDRVTRHCEIHRSLTSDLVIIIVIISIIVIIFIIVIISIIIIVMTRYCKIHGSLYFRCRHHHLCHFHHFCDGTTI